MAQPDAADALDSGTMATQFVGMVTGGWMSQAMHVAAELKVADLLTSGPKTSEELARRTGVHALFVGQHFWARGYFVSTVGRDEAVIREYIKHQEEEDMRLDQMRLWS